MCAAIGSYRQNVPKKCEQFGDLAYNSMPTHFAEKESRHYMTWFATQVTRDKPPPVLEAWLQKPEEFLGFDAF